MRMTPNPSIEGMPKRLRLSCTPHVKRYASAQPLSCLVSVQPREPVRVVAAVPRVRGLRASRCALPQRFFARRSAARRCVRMRTAQRGFGAARLGQRELRAVAERPAVCLVGGSAVKQPCRTAAQVPLNPGLHNRSFEPTNTGGRRWAVFEGLCAPVFAAQLQRWAS
jgi:hypothetical protein